MAQGQRSRFTVDELREIVNDPRFTDADLALLNEQERLAVERLRPATNRTEPVPATGFETYESPSARELWQKAVDLGLVETAGGLVGGAAGTAVAGPFGTIPGAMAGAMATRAGRGVAEGDPASAGEVLFEGGLEAVPLVGRGIKTLGRGLIRGATASSIPTELAEHLGRGKLLPMHRGAQRVFQQIADLPGGWRMENVGETTARRIGDVAEGGRPALAAAGEAGVRIDPEQVRRDAQRRVLGPEGSIGGALRSPARRQGAEGVFNEFAAMTSEEVPTLIPSHPTREWIEELLSQNRDLANVPTTRRQVRPMTPLEGQDILRRTPFEMGDLREAPGTDAALIELRSALSRALKEAVPGQADRAAELSKLIPLRDVLDDALYGGAKQQVAAPRLIATPQRLTPGFFGILPISRKMEFAAGRAAGTTGRPIASRLSPGTIRMLQGLLMPSHEPTRRQVQP